MSKQFRSLSDKLWRDFEGLCLRILQKALLDIAREATIAEDEDCLNRQLYKAIIRVSYAYIQQGDHLPPVVYEGSNPPSGSDQKRAKREFKRPDFYWAYIDEYTVSADDSAKQFVVECKRLTRPHAHYTREYVKSGIGRFVARDYGYGKGMASGAMVGYVQDIDLDDAVERVDSIADREVNAPLILRLRRGDSWADLEHELDRPFAVSPFHLKHIWRRVGVR